MKLFFTTLLISFVSVAVFGLLLNWAKRRTRRTRHGLTGMCHENGGTICASCSGKMIDECNKPR